MNEVRITTVDWRRGNLGVDIQWDAVASRTNLALQVDDDTVAIVGLDSLDDVRTLRAALDAYLEETDAECRRQANEREERFKPCECCGEGHASDGGHLCAGCYLALND